MGFEISPFHPLILLIFLKYPYFLIFSHKIDSTEAKKINLTNKMHKIYAIKA